MPTVEHVVVVLHIGGRAPRTGEQLELVPARRKRALDQRNLVLEIRRDVETAESLIAFGDVRIARAREVTAVDVRPGERVADAALWTVVRVEQLRLSFRRYLGACLRGGIGQRAADADHRLERAPRIDEDVDLGLGGG